MALMHLTNIARASYLVYPAGKWVVVPYAVVLPFLLSLALPQTLAYHGLGCVQVDWSVRPRGTQPPGREGSVWNALLNAGVPRNDPQAFDQFRQCIAFNSAGTWSHRLHQQQYSWIVPLAEHLLQRWWLLPSLPWSPMCGTGVYGKEMFPLVWLGYDQREMTMCYEPGCLGDLHSADKRTKAWFIGSSWEKFSWLPGSLGGKWGTEVLSRRIGPCPLVRNCRVVFRGWSPGFAFGCW